jgi:hypothetical protein
VNSLIVWEAILHARSVAQRFDFLGSMMEPVERVNRAFGARQVPYFYLTHLPSRESLLINTRRMVVGARRGARRVVRGC